MTVQSNLQSLHSLQRTPTQQCATVRSASSDLDKLPNSRSRAVRRLYTDRVAVRYARTHADTSQLGLPATAVSPLSAAVHWFYRLAQVRSTRIRSDLGFTG